MAMKQHKDWRVNHVLEWMDSQIYHAERSVKELKQGKEKFLRCLKDNKTENTIDSIGWFVGDIQNIIRNYRMDSAAGDASRVTQYFSEQMVSLPELKVKVP